MNDDWHVVADARFDDPDRFDINSNYHPRVDQNTRRVCSNCLQTPAVDSDLDAEDDSHVLLCRICGYKRERRVIGAKKAIEYA